jgi:hypothetical protein
MNETALVIGATGFIGTHWVSFPGPTGGKWSARIVPGTNQPTKLATALCRM